MNRPLTPDPRLPPPLRLWELMQLIETCRHRADLLDAAAEVAGRRWREELAAMAGQWRACATQIQLLDATSDAPSLKIQRHAPPENI